MAQVRVHWEDGKKYFGDFHRQIGENLDFSLKLNHYLNDLGTTKDRRRIQFKGRELIGKIRHKSAQITKDIVAQAMSTLNIDDLGLDDIDRRLLKIIAEQYNGGPVGIDSLAATLNEEVDTLVDVVEPYLLKIGLLKRTSRGRELSEAALQHLKSNSIYKEKFQKEVA